MFLMSRKIKALGVKMVLSGEGSDEIFAGYLYFHKVTEEHSRRICLYIVIYMSIFSYIYIHSYVGLF